MMKMKGIVFILAAGAIGGFIGYRVDANATDYARQTLIGAISHQQASDMDYEKHPVSAHNRKIVAAALTQFLKDCPELGDDFDSVDPDTVHVAVVVKNTHQLMRLFGTEHWPSYVEVTMHLKKKWDDLDYRLVHHFHDAPGDMIGYYIGGGQAPGVMVQKGIRIIPTLGDYECGQKVTKEDRKLFHSVVASDPKMAILDGLH